MRSRPLLKERPDSRATVGLLLRQGVGDPLTGVPAGALAEAHTRLADLWPAAALSALRERLEEVPALAARLDLVESFLAALWGAPSRLSPEVAHALARFDQGTGVAQVAAECDWSHRHFAGRFREAVGLGPKTYCRVRRFGRVLDRLSACQPAQLADIAAAEGYADQAHMSREFRAFAGLSPGRYRRIAPRQPHHVPL